MKCPHVCQISRSLDFERETFYKTKEKPLGEGYLHKVPILHRWHRLIKRNLATECHQIDEGCVD